MKEKSSRSIPAFISAVTRLISIPILAVFTAMLIGALIIWASGGDPITGYIGLWEGALGRTRSLSETIVAATPYIFAGLAVALAFRGGLFCGYSLGLPWAIAGQMGSLAAAYVVAQLGPQSHHYTPAEFVARYREHFDDGGALDPLLAQSVRNG